MKLYPDAALKYVNESGRVRTPASRATTLQHLRHLQACHPRVDLDAFTHDRLHAFCVRDRPDGGRPAAGTVKSRRGQVVSFFEWATFTGLLEVNPAAKLKYSVRPANTFVRSHTWLSEEQLVRLVRSFPATVAGRRDRVVCMILAFTGLRVFEVAALRWAQFSADLRTLTLIGKGSKLAEVGVPPQLVEVLWKWRMTCLSDDVVIPAVRSVRNWGGGGDSLLVEWERPLLTSGIRTIVRNAGTRVGVPTLRPHDLRRSYAGLLEAKGVGVKDISLALRHSNIATTDRYLERNPARAVAVGNQFTIDMGDSNDQ